MKRKALIALLKEALEQEHKVEFAYLFGSYARDDHSANSDVDIAIYLKDSDFDTLLEINYRLSKTLNKDVDFTLLNSVKNIYLMETILKEGLLLKDSKKRVDFELRKEHEILDYKAFRRYIDAA